MDLVTFLFMCIASTIQITQLTPLCKSEGGAHLVVMASALKIAGATFMQRFFSDMSPVSRIGVFWPHGSIEEGFRSACQQDVFEIF